MKSRSRMNFGTLLVAGALIHATAACTADTSESASDDLTASSGSVIQFPRETFERLDYGIYWFGPNATYQKAVAGQANPHFDPRKPTLIYVHGWQKDTTEQLSREAFNYVKNQSPDMYLADIWINAGWNVGLMYWNQFADEDLVADAEAKIWTANGPKKMRWMNADGVYSDGPGKSAGQLFYESYASAMAGYQGDTIRIAGHSLGNQMAVAVTKRISDGVAAGEISARLLPKRVALLDPVYIAGGRSYLGGAWTGELARAHVSELAQKGVLFEAYRSSALSGAIGPLVDKNDGLMKMVALTDLKPDFLSSKALAERHSAAVWTYLWSLSFSPPRVEGESRLAPSASLPDKDVAAWMASTQRLVQKVGTRSHTPGDDSMSTAAK